MLQAWLCLLFVLSSSAFAAGPTCPSDKVKLIRDAKAPVWKLYPQSKKVFVGSMSKDLANFYGANTQLFYYELQKLTPQFGQDYAAAATALGTGPIFGDAHFGNLGVYDQKSSEHYAINDVDDAAIAPRIYDLVRGAVSLTIQFPKISQAKLLASFISGYEQGISVGQDFSNDLFDDQNLATVLIPQKNLDEPEPPKSAWHPAEQALRELANLSKEDFDKQCKKFAYKPFHGGSSIGLPRFRVTCDDVTYEVKACIASAVDEILGNKKTCNGGKNIQDLASKLSPKFAKPFIVASALQKIPEFAAFGFYGHIRSDDIPEIDDSNEPEVVAITQHFGKVIGAGHARSSNRVANWNSAFANRLQNGLMKAIPAMLGSFKQDFQTIPKCL